MVPQSAILEDSHYSICLPVRKKSLHMPNRAVAEQHALNLHKTFSRDFKFQGEYVAFLDNLFKKGSQESREVVLMRLHQETVAVMAEAMFH